MTSRPARVQCVDVLRGVAILGILAMNVRDFGLPLAAFDRPALAGGNGVLNVTTWALGDIIFQDKMIALLSLLFGAGLWLQTESADAEGSALAGRWYRRCAWLLLFGLVHAIGLWYGDILNTYALAGMLLYPLRRVAPRKLLLLGALVLLVTLAFDYGPMLWDLLRARFGSGAAREAAGNALAKLQPVLHPALPATLAPPPDMSDEIAVYRGTWWATVKHHWGMFFAWHIVGGWRISLWRSGGLMLIGVALARLGVFRAMVRTAAERWMLRLGYGVGLPLVLLALAALHARNLLRAGLFDPQSLGPVGSQLFGWTLLLRRALSYSGAILVALGHAALLLAWCRRGSWPGFQQRLAAVGRMALTCYLMQTLLCVLFFYGYGLGRFARLSLAELWLVVIPIWILQLWLCPRWLERFEQGPMEWTWRSLVAGRRLPWRRTAAATTAA